MFTVTTKGSFKRSEAYLNRMKNLNLISVLNSCGRRGVAALSNATPVESNLTASSWDYRLAKTGSGIEIQWINRNVVDGVNIAVILQYGHGTGTGGYVAGQDYINPAMRPIFDDILDDVRKAVRFR